jgi:hypothetical protein
LGAFKQLNMTLRVASQVRDDVTPGPAGQQARLRDFHVGYLVKGGKQTSVCGNASFDVFLGSHRDSIRTTNQSLLPRARPRLELLPIDRDYLQGGRDRCAALASESRFHGVTNGRAQRTHRSDVGVREDEGFGVGAVECAVVGVGAAGGGEHVGSLIGVDHDE